MSCESIQTNMICYSSYSNKYMYVDLLKSCTKTTPWVNRVLILCMYMYMYVHTCNNPNPIETKLLSSLARH